MTDTKRFDVDFYCEERGLQHFYCEDGDYVLASDYVKLEEKVIALEEWQEKMREKFSIAVQIDLEHGVQWMNEEASAEFAKKYPNLCDALSLLEEDEGEDPNE